MRLMSSGVRATALAIASAAALLPVAALAGQQLGSAEINELVPGATVNIDTPLGVPLPIRFNPDGTVSGTAGKLEFYLKSQTDKGRWWVADGKLCQKWRRWFDAKVTCLSLERQGEKFTWERDDGTKGTASIVGRASVAVAEVPPATQPETKVPTLAEKVVAALTPAAPGPAGLGAPEQAKAPASVASAAQQPKLVTVPQPVAAPKPLASPRIAAAHVAPQPVQPAENVRASGGILYRVVNVARDDTLNIRDMPGQHGRVVATVRPNAHGIILTGSCNGYWCPVLAGNATGWVNRYYLSLQPMMVSAR